MSEAEEFVVMFVLVLEVQAFGVVFALALEVFVLLGVLLEFVLVGVQMLFASEVQAFVVVGVALQAFV